MSDRKEALEKIAREVNDEESHAMASVESLDEDTYGRDDHGLRIAFEHDQYRRQKMDPDMYDKILNALGLYESPSHLWEAWELLDFEINQEERPHDGMKDAVTGELLVAPASVGERYGRTREVVDEDEVPPRTDFRTTDEEP